MLNTVSGFKMKGRGIKDVTARPRRRQSSSERSSLSGIWLRILCDDIH